MIEHVSLRALENGLDFIESGLKYIQHQPGAKDLKYAVLHINAGIELVLKDRLRKEHWSLVFANIDKAELEAYESGNFNSVDLKTCIERLVNICHVSIETSSSKSLISFKKLRNQFEHFEVNTSIEAVTSLATKSLGFLIDFIANEYPDKDLEGSNLETFRSIQKLLPTFYDFVTQRMDELDKHLDKLEVDYPILTCPACLQNALVIEDQAHCYFCRYQASGVAAAREYTFSTFGIDWRYVAEGGEEPIYECFECSNQSLVDVGVHTFDRRKYRFVCFSCGNNWGWEQVEFCGNCGQPFEKSPTDTMLICNNCFSAAVAKD